MLLPSLVTILPDAPFIQGPSRGSLLQRSLIDLQWFCPSTAMMIERDHAYDEEKDWRNAIGIGIS